MTPPVDAVGYRPACGGRDEVGYRPLVRESGALDPIIGVSLSVGALSSHHANQTYHRSARVAIQHRDCAADLDQSGVGPCGFRAPWGWRLSRGSGVRAVRESTSGRHCAQHRGPRSRCQLGAVAAVAAADHVPGGSVTTHQSRPGPTLTLILAALGTNGWTREGTVAWWERATMRAKPWPEGGADGPSAPRRHLFGTGRTAFCQRKSVIGHDRRRRMRPCPLAGTQKR